MSRCWRKHASGAMSPRRDAVEADRPKKRILTLSLGRPFEKDGNRHSITLTLFLVSPDKPSRPLGLEHLISSNTLAPVLQQNRLHY